MVTISHLVKGFIEKNPFIEEALSRSLINYAALADSLKDDIEKQLKKEVKSSAIMMALRRYSEKANNKLFNKFKFDKDTDISLRSNLIELTINKSSNSGILIKNVYDMIDPKIGDFISITQGLHEISIITNEKYEKDILKIIKKSDLKSIIKDLSSITINIPENSTETIGLFYIITRALSWENIPIIEIVSTWSELTLMVKTEEAPRTFKVLNDLIKSN